MKIKNTKYILVLLAGIISLASGCSCGKGDEGKGSSAEVAILEAAEKKLLEELRPLYLEFRKHEGDAFDAAAAVADAARRRAPYVYVRYVYDEAKETKVFERLVTDTEANSFITQWRLAKGAVDRGDIETMSDLATGTAGTIEYIEGEIDSTAFPKYKAFLEKRLELYKNRLKMIEAYLGIETKEDKK